MSEAAPGRSGRRKGRTRRTGRGLLGTVFTAILVVAAGFSIGVVAGLALEDPSLVKDYVAGDTLELELGASPAASGGSESDGPLGAPPPQRRGFSIQVGAFADAAAARRLAEELEGAGYPVYVAAPERGDNGTREQRWRVRVGPLTTRSRAESVARELKSGRSLPTWVLDETAS